MKNDNLRENDKEIKDPVRDISDEEFEMKLKDLEPHEREFAIKWRNKEKF